MEICWNIESLKSKIIICSHYDLNLFYIAIVSIRGQVRSNQVDPLMFLCWLVTWHCPKWRQSDVAVTGRYVLLTWCVRWCVESVMTRHYTYTGICLVVTTIFLTHTIIIRLWITSVFAGLWACIFEKNTTIIFELDFWSKLFFYVEIKKNMF